MTTHSLAGNTWTLAGFYDEGWRQAHAHTPSPRPHHNQATPWIAASVPGSVHADLLRSGLIADPYIADASLACEWVHQRHWVYRTTFEWRPCSERTALVLDGVDPSADVFLNGDLLGEATSLYAPARFELDDARLRAGLHTLAIVVHPAPAGTGDAGRLTQIRTHRPRLGYHWDFCCRLQNLGVWRDVRLEATGRTRIADVCIRTSGAVAHVVTTLDGPDVPVEVTIIAPDGSVAGRGRGTACEIEVAGAQLWWPNGEGAQPLYRCRVRAGDEGLDTTFGFRTVALTPNPGAPPEARNYTLTVNGRELFMRGWNWVPVDAMYGRGDLDLRYEQLVRLARDARVNLLRVWGGGIVERSHFYDLCDRAGICVWQEFSLSSAGIDNLPAHDPVFLDMLRSDARAIVRSRRNHASLSIWCGGNELCGEGLTPVDDTDPAVAVLADAVRELDPGRPFLPTSPSGPLFSLARGVAEGRLDDMHDVHGTWEYSGVTESYRLPNASAALLHSEFGSQGAAATSTLRRFLPERAQRPPEDDDPDWRHHGAMWMHGSRVREAFGATDDLDDYVAMSQYLQAEHLRYWTEANRRRRPRCSGSIPWQFNEPWPNAHCTSVIDHSLWPKMAYWYVRNAYAPVAGSLEYQAQLMPDAILRATPHIAADVPFEGQIEVTASGVDGATFFETKVCEPFATPMPTLAVCTVTVRAQDGTIVHANRYVFTTIPREPLAQLRALRADVAAKRTSDGVRIENMSSSFAFFLALHADDPAGLLDLDDNFITLAPGEAVHLNGGIGCTAVTLHGLNVARRIVR